ncbi:MAG: 50S ribosomal protein L9 [Bacteroidetes bacterium 47-18]|nr:MAG: 50S ribosomal protein L9 [Bacteroidetes bacterium 47-18]
MQVILIKDVDNLGAANELVNVRPGYARNYLIPQKFAVEASGSNKKILAEKHKVAARKEEKLLADIAKVAQVLSAEPVKITARIGENGKIFGSVTSVQIGRAIREQKGYEIDRRKINIVDEVREAGTFNAILDFGAGKNVEFKFEVVAE